MYRYPFRGKGQTLICQSLPLSGGQAAMLLSTIMENLANPLTATLTTQPTSELSDILIFLKKSMSWLICRKVSMNYI